MPDHEEDQSRPGDDASTPAESAAPNRDTPLTDAPSTDATGATQDAPMTGSGDEILPLGAPVATKAGVPKSAIVGVLVALVVAAGALAVLQASGGNPPSNIATVVPADVLGFGAISVEPTGAQRDALRSLLGRLSEDKRTEVLSSFDDAMGDLLGDGDDFQRDIRPWLGPQFGVSAIVVGEEPVFVATVGVTDEAAATAFFERKKTDGADAFEIVGDVAYLGEEQAHLTAFRERAAQGTLADNPAFKKELAAVGGEGLAVLWLNGEEIGKQASLVSGVLGRLAVPGLDASAGSAVFVLRAEEKGLAFVGHQSGGPTPGTKPGRPVLLEGAPAAMLGGLSIFDLKGSFAQLQEATEPGLLAGYQSFLDALGLDLKNDLLAWLGGEVTVIATPLLEFALIADITDDAAFQRTIDGLTTSVAPALELGVRRESNGLTASNDRTAVVMRRNADKVVIGVGSDVAATQRLANGLLTPGGNRLGDSAAYKAVIGAPSDQTVFQAYVNLAVLGPFLGQGGSLAVLEPFEAAMMRVTLTEGGSEIRLMLTLA